MKTHNNTHTQNKQTQHTTTHTKKQTNGEGALRQGPHGKTPGPQGFLRGPGLQGLQGLQGRRQGHGVRSLDPPVWRGRDLRPVWRRRDLRP